MRVIFCIVFASVCSPGDHQSAAGMHVQTLHQRGGIRDSSSRDRGIRRRGSLHDVRALQKILRLTIDTIDISSSLLNVTLLSSRSSRIPSGIKDILLGILKKLVRKSPLKLCGAVWYIIIFFFLQIKARSRLFYDLDFNM